MLRQERPARAQKTSDTESLGVGEPGQLHFTESLISFLTTGESGLTRNFSLLGDATGDGGEGAEGKGIQFRIASACWWVIAIFVASEGDGKIFWLILKDSFEEGVYQQGNLKN